MTASLPNASTLQRPGSSRDSVLYGCNAGTQHTAYTNAAETDPSVMFILILAIAVAVIGKTATLNAMPAPTGYLSPTALVAAKDGKVLFIACATANRILCFDTASQRVLNSIAGPGSPLGLALSADHTRLLVTCAAAESSVCIIATAEQRLVGTLPGGHTALAPVISPNGKTLYTCNRFNNDVSVFELAAKREIRHIRVQREPVAADLTKDGKFLLVANLLHTGRADVEDVASVISVIDVAIGKVPNELRLPSGSGVVGDLRISPDGKFAAATHLFAAFSRATSQIRSGWMNANALSLIDLGEMKVRYTLLLDQPEAGAANPSGLAWSADGSILVVAHSGTHEVSVIDFPLLLQAAADAEREHPQGGDHTTGTHLHLPVLTGREAKPILAFVPRYQGMLEGLPFLVGARRRVKLPEADLGPRAVVVVGYMAYTANYFSDTLTAIDLRNTNCRPKSISLSDLGPRDPRTAPDQARRGEFYFHDATICFQGWQSCSSCHPGQARVDGFNWDLLNDGIGNPKNTKSLLLAHSTPPAMWLGVRDTAETAVRAGIKHILFAPPKPEVVDAIDAYLKSLKPLPNPYLVHGKFSKPALRGKKVFDRAGCVACHPPPAFTDLRQYDVGTRRGFDAAGDKFDTPTLVELWRTAPYLHDGSAATVREVLTTRNPHDHHGNTSHLTSEEIDHLCAYLLSL
jgi:DNA-binding beta-propeller fold protein YncE